MVNAVGLPCLSRCAVDRAALARSTLRRHVPSLCVAGALITSEVALAAAFLVMFTSYRGPVTSSGSSFDKRCPTPTHGGQGRVQFAVPLCTPTVVPVGPGWSPCRADSANYSPLPVVAATARERTPTSRDLTGTAPMGPSTRVAIEPRAPAGLDPVPQLSLSDGPGPSLSKPRNVERQRSFE